MSGKDDGKVCNCCGLWWEFSAYQKNKSKPDGLQGSCRNCQNKYVEASTEKLRKEVAEYKEEHGCSICGLHDEACVFDFHHIGPKRGEVSQLISFGPTVVWAEIENCVCLCANCHRKVTYGDLDALSVDRI